MKREEQPLCSVANANQIIGELFNRIGRGASLHCLGEMRDQNSLRRLNDNHAFFPLVNNRSAIHRLECPRWTKLFHTFMPYRLLSSAFIVTYRLPAIWNPTLWTFLTVDLSE